MKLTLLSASAAALLALGIFSASASAAPIGSGLDGLRSASGLAQRADYDGGDWRRDRGSEWQHHSRDNDDRRWWSRHRSDRYDAGGTPGVIAMTGTIATIAAGASGLLVTRWPIGPPDWFGGEGKCRYRSF